MKLYSITFIGFLLFFAAQVNAQFMPGNVVMHSDPRLAVLLKQNPTAMPPVTPVSYPEESPRKKHNRSKDETKSVKREMLPQAPTHDIPVLSSSREIAANTPKKPIGPPVRQFTTPSLHKDGRVLFEGRGFRVQIYNGTDREKAIKVKTEFMRLYPGMRTYFSYVAPHFRIKVGDYRNRSDAVGMLKEANSMYDSPCMIVPDDIIIHAN